VPSNSSVPLVMRVMRIWTKSLARRTLSRVRNAWLFSQMQQDGFWAIVELVVRYFTFLNNPASGTSEAIKWRNGPLNAH
jgi:hypothetical protein